MDRCGPAEAETETRTHAGALERISSSKRGGQCHCEAAGGMFEEGRELIALGRDAGPVGLLLRRKSANPLPMRVFFQRNPRRRPCLQPGPLLSSMSHGNPTAAASARYFETSTRTRRGYRSWQAQASSPIFESKATAPDAPIFSGSWIMVLATKSQSGGRPRGVRDGCSSVRSEGLRDGRC